MDVKLCEGFELKEELLVNYTEKGKRMMILDIGAPVSLVGKKWIEDYLKEQDVGMDNMKMESCSQMFRFGPSKKYISNQMIELPMVVSAMDGREEVLRLHAYIVDAEIPFLCGKRTLEGWNAKIDTQDEVLETEIEGRKRNFQMVTTESNHYGLEIGLKNESIEEIMFTDGSDKEEMESYRKIEEVLYEKGEDPLDSYKAIKRVHEVTSHKSADQMIRIYKNAGLIGPEVPNMIRRVIKDCKICQKFGKSRRAKNHMLLRVII